MLLLLSRQLEIDLGLQHAFLPPPLQSSSPAPTSCSTVRHSILSSTAPLDQPPSTAGAPTVQPCIARLAPLPPVLLPLAGNLCNCHRRRQTTLVTATRRRTHWNTQLASSEPPCTSATPGHRRIASGSAAFSNVDGRRQAALFTVAS